MGGLPASAPVVEVPVIEHSFFEQVLRLAGLNLRATALTLDGLPILRKDAARAVALLVVESGPYRARADGLGAGREHRGRGQERGQATPRSPRSSRDFGVASVSSSWRCLLERRRFLRRGSPGTVGGGVLRSSRIARKRPVFPMTFRTTLVGAGLLLVVSGGCASLLGADLDRPAAATADQGRRRANFRREAGVDDVVRPPT